MKPRMALTADERQDAADDGEPDCDCVIIVSSWAAFDPSRPERAANPHSKHRSQGQLILN